MKSGETVGTTASFTTRDLIDEGGADALEVRARARRLKRQYSKLGLIVIDYPQL